MGSLKPREVKHVVMSVPHSGTRTLQHWLGEHRPETIHSRMRDVPPHWHFNFHPHYISKFFLYAADLKDGRMAYIPVRNPFDVCDSWQRRYHGHREEPFEEITQPLGLMVNVINQHADHLEIFKMEELPVTRGHGPRPEGWDKDKTLASVRFKKMRKWILSTEEVEAFYRTYYNAEELWWL